MPPRVTIPTVTTTVNPLSGLMTGSFTLPNVPSGPYSLTLHADPATDAVARLVVGKSPAGLAFDQTLCTLS